MTFLQPQGKRRGGARRSEWNRKRRATLGRRRSSLQYSSVEKLVRTTHVRVYHTSSFRPWRAEKPLRVVVVVVVSRPRARFTRIRGNFTGRSSLIRTHHAKERKRKAIERERREDESANSAASRVWFFGFYESRRAATRSIFRERNSAPFVFPLPPRYIPRGFNGRKEMEIRENSFVLKARTTGFFSFARAFFG